MSVAKDERYPSVLDFGREIFEHATSAGRVQWGDVFAPTGAPLSPPTLAKGGPPSLIESAMANMTTQHSASTAHGWTGAGGGAGTEADTSGEKKPTVGHGRSGGGSPGAIRRVPCPADHRAPAHRDEDRRQPS
ncbi:MAG TPA: hypothetical protein VF524_06035, partial [Polyangia bacterium]